MVFVGVCVLLSLPLAAAPATKKRKPEISTTVVISQFQVAGGSAADEFIELHNVGGSPFDLNGYRVVYRSANGVNDIAIANWSTGTVIPVGGYYLIGNTVGYDDSVLANVTWTSGPTGSFSATGGGIAIRNGALNSGTLIDSVGYGTATNAFVEVTAVAAPASNDSRARKNDGCQDTDNNANDFQTASPAAPRNASSDAVICAATHTPTSTATFAATFTPTDTATFTPTDTPTSTGTFTATFTPTETPTSTETFAATFTPTDTPTSTGTFTATFTPTFTPTSVPAGAVVINEVAWSGTDASSSDEWLELYNTTANAIDVTNWTLSDGGDVNIVLSGSIPALGYYLLERTDDTTVNDLIADKIYTGGLNNGGEALSLRDAWANVIDTANGNGGAWPAGTASPPCSMERIDASQVDADTNWATNDNVNRNGLDADGNAICGTPKQQNSASLSGTPTATATSTNTATPTATPTGGPTFTATPTATATHTSTPFPSGIVINEFLPDPASDWNGDTNIDSDDEWIELFNTNAFAVDVGGWKLDDVDAGGSTPYTIPSGTTIAAHGFLIFYASASNVALNNTGDSARLLYPDDAVADSTSYSSSADDETYARNPNGTGAFTTACAPTPNALNCSAPPTDTPTSAATFTPTSTATFTPTFTRTPAPGGLYVNEFMPDPAQDWNDDTLADDNDEWIEIYNANAFSVDLSGWKLDDVANGGSAAYTIPGGTHIAANGFLLFYRAATNLALNNSNDDVRLLQPDDTVADTISYKTSLSNAAWARVPDGANYFSIYCPPTPNASNCSVAPTPTLTPTPLAKKIFINEFLPAPYQDWNHDNILDAGDEWIELYNASNQPVDLSGWQIDDAKNGSAPYQIPDGTQLDARSFMLLFARDTNVGLNNDGDTVRLLYPDDTVADKYKYEPIATNKSYARVPDGAAKWSTLCIPTPGAPNCTNNATAAPTRVFNLTTIAEARALPLGSAVSVLGSVIAHPCEFDLYGHELVLSDGSAGINVYMGFPARMSCLLPRHEQIVVTGVISDHYGLTTLYPESNFDLTRHYQEPRALAPRAVHTGNFGENAESMLVTIQGQVSNGKNGDTLWVNDGTGAVQVYADEFSHTTFEGIPRGSIVRITGVGYQYNGGVLPEEGYYLRVRAPDDVLVLERAEKLPEAPGGRGGVDLGAVAIDQARAAAAQNYVTVGGVVTMPPGVVDDRAFWLQDASGGIHVFVSTTAGALPAMQLHDNVSVRGRLVNSFGARELRVELPDAIGVHGAGAPAAPVTLQTGQVDLSREGALVQIHGWVARFDGREIYIDDGSGPVLVYIDADTGIRWPRLHIGDPAMIRGIVARFRGAPEILPRLQRDVQFGAALLPIAGAPAPTFLYQLRALGRVGEDLMWTQKVDAHAAGAAARVYAPSPKRAAKTHSPAALQLQMLRARDAVTALTLLLLALSGVCGVIAAHKYRGARRRR